jgi:hypothetical protein
MSGLLDEGKSGSSNGKFHDIHGRISLLALVRLGLGSRVLCFLSCNFS